MTTRDVGLCGPGGGFPFSAVIVAASLLSASAVAQVTSDAGPPTPLAPEYVLPDKTELSTLYADGSTLEISSEQRWRFSCGTDRAVATQALLEQIANDHLAKFENGGGTVVDRGRRGAGINIVFVTDGSEPAGALNALAMAETYIESVFSDDINVRIQISFANLGDGVLGATGSFFVSNVSYAISRDGLQAGMDGDDVLQSFLPTGNRIPVRYNGATDTVSNENLIDWTRSAYRSTIGTTSGRAADMTFNNTFNWDFNPSNGVGSRQSFVDVIIHEVGHALGFVSAADGGGNSMDAMDIFRFQRSDGCCNYDPDTNDDFQTTPRLVSFNSPNDSHNIDLISASYRMSDGNPWQASHFRERTPSIRQMDPAQANGETFFPDFYSGADLAVFDALGYDYPPQSPCGFDITNQPVSQTVCEGDDTQFTVADTAVTPSYQWRIGNLDLSDGVKYSGVNSATLIIHNVTALDEANNYNVLVTDDSIGCGFSSGDAALTVSTDTPQITSQPPNQMTVNVGGFADISVVVAGPFTVAYQWRKDGVAISDSANVFGTISATLSIDPVALVDAGVYDCVITKIASGCATTSNATTLNVNNPGNCPGDVDGDNDVDLADLSVLLANFGTPSAATLADGDLDGDGDVDLADLSVMLSNFGAAC